MSEESNHLERIRNLWAPWRTEYIESLHDESDGCFICRYRDDTAHDRENLVLRRSRRCLVILNRYPYTGGHILVAPLEHVAQLADMDTQTMLEMMELLRDVQQILAETLDAEGFNIGINVGRCSGAGLPGHLHAHIVPRWMGDTNFMSVLADVRVIPMSLTNLYDKLLGTAERLALPKLSGPDRI